MMAESGGADQIAKALLGAFGKERVHWAMMFVAFIVGIPLFFEIGFVLLIPLVFIMARRVDMPLVKIAIPLLAGLSVVHGLVPPHPGPLLAISIFGADIGKTILYGLIVGLPTAIIAGPLFGSFIARFVVTEPSPELAQQLAHEPEAKTLPGVGITLVTVLLPVFLMLLKSFADAPSGDYVAHGGRSRGNPTDRPRSSRRDRRGRDDHAASSSVPRGRRVPGSLSRPASHKTWPGRRKRVVCRCCRA
jgi:GntP family gluconate:H+ symporter